MREELSIDLSEMQLLCSKYIQIINLLQLDLMPAFAEIQNELALGYKAGSFKDYILEDPEQRSGIHWISTLISDFLALTTVTEHLIENANLTMVEADQMLAYTQLDEILNRGLDSNVIDQNYVNNLLNDKENINSWVENREIPDITNTSTETPDDFVFNYERGNQQMSHQQPQYRSQNQETLHTSETKQAPEYQAYAETVDPVYHTSSLNATSTQSSSDILKEPSSTHSNATVMAGVGTVGALGVNLGAALNSSAQIESVEKETTILNKENANNISNDKMSREKYTQSANHTEEKEMLSGGNSVQYTIRQSKQEAVNKQIIHEDSHMYHNQEREKIKNSEHIKNTREIEKPRIKEAVEY